ncbi:unnamed protein product [Ixodes pacificus]
MQSKESPKTRAFQITTQKAPRACEHLMYFARLNIQILQKYTKEVVLHLGTSNESKRSKVFFVPITYLVYMYIFLFFQNFTTARVSGKTVLVKNQFFLHIVDLLHLQVCRLK